MLKKLTCGPLELHDLAARHAGACGRLLPVIHVGDDGFARVVHVSPRIIPVEFVDLLERGRLHITEEAMELAKSGEPLKLPVTPPRRKKARKGSRRHGQPVRAEGANARG
jgi:hypothetical protein